MTPFWIIAIVLPYVINRLKKEAKWRYSIRFMFTSLGTTGSTKKRLHWHWDLKVFFQALRNGGGGRQLILKYAVHFGVVRLVLQFTVASPILTFISGCVSFWVTASLRGKKSRFRFCCSSGWSWKVQNHNGWEIAHLCCRLSLRQKVKSLDVHFLAFAHYWLIEFQRYIIPPSFSFFFCPNAHRHLSKLAQG